ncbi:MAG: hypothetical protein FJX73_08190 [Armatimonadetes bacterium]|nr:hypothetical protein [Armatimonadota bacterium]
MKRLWVWFGVTAAVVVVVGAGFYYYARSRPAAQPQRPRDPGFLVILSIRTLEREPETRLSREQIAKVLPLIKALKDVPLSDVEASMAIVRAVGEVFTAEQRAALEEARMQFRERARAQGVPGGQGAGGAALGPGLGPAGAGAGADLTDEERAQRRARTFERMIRYLERRMKS